MKRRVSLSTGYYQYHYGDERALEIAKEIGADAIDFSLTGMDLNQWMTFAAVWMITVLLFMAMDLPKALPPTVRPATTADIKS